MKPIKIFLFLFFVGIHFCWAQDTTIVLSTSMLDKNFDQIYLGDFDGWIFKHGNDTGLAKINIDAIGWTQLKPTQLSPKYADKNGRVEGWFRLKVKFDSSFLRQQTGFDFVDWAATEYYIDGKLIAARGNAGENGKPFREYNNDEDPVFLRFETSVPHILVIHFVGYLSPIPPYRLRGQTDLVEMPTLLGSNYNTALLKYEKNSQAFSYTWLIVCALLSVLFWLLRFQNPQEKNLFWIGLYTTILTLSIYCLIMQISIGNTYTASVIYSALNKFFSGGIFLLILPILLIEVFKRKIRRVLLLGLSILYAFNFILWFFIPQPYSSIQQFALVASFIFVLGICFYYVITSWKSLMGAQWAIVVGLIFSIFSLVAGFILELVFKNLNNSLYFGYQVESCFILSFPLSLLAYVSIRFKEIINEVGLNAKRVIELSEEKKVQAENQQKVLQVEVNKQTSELRNTLENLRSAQSQLIQSEKMASLGELTAGIAHEIQNPLNFMNNFSEVNKELLVEMKDEIKKGNMNEVDAIADDVISNEEKINHHGKRADAIVKGMLQHSRTSSGVKEPTDINALADEYFRLAYHGLRAKDKDFNATMNTDFDKSIGKIDIIPQDIGRVLLNLYNNAFYAVSEKKKQLPGGYEPMVSVSTKRINDKVEIRVKDNGNGIPQKVVDKIFQPFFTTKPTGQGTGLGLSLSYDIIKSHHGEIKVQTKEGEGSEFVIQLPLTH